MPTACVECGKYVATLFVHTAKKKVCMKCFKEKFHPPATVIHTPPLVKGWQECFFTVSVLPEGLDVRFEPKE